MNCGCSPVNWEGFLVPGICRSHIDRDPLAYGGSSSPNDYWLDTIDFTDHVDASGRQVLNFTYHHASDLEALGTQISGTTAEEKIWSLAQVAINERESLDSMPVFIIEFFADDI